jgi:hypothetical protein
MAILESMAFWDYNNKNAANRFVAGQYDEIRWTDGVSRYTENFTPLTKQFGHSS